MFGFTGNLRFFLYRIATDMRKGHDGLCGLVINELGCTPDSGDIFIFINRRQTHIKLLYWDKTGFVIYHKRLESGTFELPDSSADHLEVAREDLMMILEGVCLKKARKRKRYIS